jgi:hypothetical protein
VTLQASLSLRELNRITLARQLLLKRASLPAPEAIERLAGLHAQGHASPYVALWSRLHDFERDDLARPIADQAVVKATMMRATLHLVTAADYPRLRATLAAVLEGASGAIARGCGTASVDLDAAVEAGRRLLAEKPRTFAEITSHLLELMPRADPGPLRYAIRTRLPLVQVPTEARWSYPGNPQFALAESWLGQSGPEQPDLRALFHRYLAAFGPATVADFQAWSGLAKQKEAVEPLLPELIVYRRGRGADLLDLPGLPVSDPDTPAPPRFLPEWDSLLLAHQVRTRIVADEHRSRVYLPGLRVAATFLIDGFVAGAWRVESSKAGAALVVEPFGPLAPGDRDALAKEGERLLRFVEPGAASYNLSFAE